MEKKHLPSEKRLKKAHENGDSPNAPFFVNGIITLAVITLIGMGGPFVFVRLKNLVELFQEVNSSKVFLQQNTLLLFCLMLMVSAISVFAILFATILVKRRGAFTINQSLNAFGNVLAPGKYFSQSLSYGKDLFWWPARGALLLLPLLWGGESFGFSFKTLLWCSVVLGISIIVVGGVQCLCSYKRWIKKLMMTDKELIDEMKEDEGDPHHRSYRQHLHRELSLEDRVKRSRVILIDTMGEAQ